MLLRVRVTSFLAGVALAGSAALYQLRKDIWDSHTILQSQASHQLAQRIDAVPAGVLSIGKAS